MKTPGLIAAALFAAIVPAFAQSVSTSATYSLLQAPPGASSGGGRVTNVGGTVTADISVGDPVSGGVSNAPWAAS